MYASYENNFNGVEHCFSHTMPSLYLTHWWGIRKTDSRGWSDDTVVGHFPCMWQIQDLP